MDNPGVQQALNTFVQTITAQVSVERMYLYGSALWSDAPQDLDLIVIGDFKGKDPTETIYDLYTHVPRSLECHAYGYESEAQIPSFLKVYLADARVIFGSISNLR